jgi:hypothetical protein
VTLVTQQVSNGKKEPRAPHPLSILKTEIQLTDESEMSNSQKLNDKFKEEESKEGLRMRKRTVRFLSNFCCALLEGFRTRILCRTREKKLLEIFLSSTTQCAGALWFLAN